MRIPPLLLSAVLALTAGSVLFAAEPGAEPWLRAAAHLDHEALARGKPFRAAVVLDLDAGYHVNANSPSLEFQVPTAVRPAPHEGIGWGEAVYPEGEPLDADWAGDETVRAYSGRTILLVPGTVAADAPLGPATLTFTLKYQGCDASTCYPPAERTLEVATEIVAADAEPAPANADIFKAVRAAPAEGAAEGAEPPPAIRFEGEVDVAGWLERGPILYALFLMIGGVALNLTPCVFPLIPITMNVFASQGEGRPLKILPLASTYALGIALTFTVVGVLSALAGQSMGLVLETPWGVLAIVTILAVMMASIFGAFEIRVPTGAVGRLGPRRGLVGAAFMGMVMGAVAAPCVGPFLISLITFVAAEQSVLFGATSFFAVGLGLGLPYVFLGTFTGLVNRFPRSGGWMVWTKRLMGMTLAGVILYYLRPFLAPAMFWPMVLALFVFAAVYLGLLEGLSRRPFTRRFWMVRIAAAVALLAAGIHVYATYAPGSAAVTPVQGASAGGAEQPQTSAPHVAWTAWHPGALAEARQAGRGILLYFTADWCTECFAWKVGLFAHPEVIRASRALDRICVDLTERPPADSPKGAFADAYRGRNPPAVLVFDADGRFLKGWNTPPDAETFVETLRQAASRGDASRGQGSSRGVRAEPVSRWEKRVGSEVRSP